MFQLKFTINIQFVNIIVITKYIYRSK